MVTNGNNTSGFKAIKNNKAFYTTFTTYGPIMTIFGTITGKSRENVKMMAKKCLKSNERSIRSPPTADQRNAARKCNLFSPLL